MAFNSSIMEIEVGSNPKVREALTEFMACVQQGFTGSWNVEFVLGIPQLRKRADTKRYGKPENGQNLTGGS